MYVCIHAQVYHILFIHSSGDFVVVVVVLAVPRSLWDLSSLTGNQTQCLAVKALSPNHWIAGEFPMHSSVDGHLVWFHLLTTGNNAAVNIGV